MALAGRIALFAAGFGLTVAALGSAMRTVVLPRAVRNRLVRVVFVLLRYLFRAVLGRRPTYERRDRVFAVYAPVAMLVLLQVWLALVFVGGAAMFTAVGHRGLRHGLGLSGSSLLTLGFVAPRAAPETALAFGEASVGLVMVALLITFLPSLYSAFSRREQAVVKLQVRAGSPPSGEEMLWRAVTLGREQVLLESFTEFESWFVDVDETHSSYPMLVFFRSPQPDHSWVTAAGAVLDAAALTAGALQLPRPVEAELLLRAGWLCLRRIATFYDIPLATDPQRGDPISIRREEFEAALDRLAAAGAPIRADREAAWLDFAGWRVNYDAALLALAALTQAPYAPWSSDRSLAGVRLHRLVSRRGDRPAR